MRHRVALLGMVSSLVLATPTAAVADTHEASKDGTDCLVQYLDERGEVEKSETEPEGKEYGQFRCVAGQWQFTWDPFGPDDLILADEIQVDPAGSVTARYITGPALTGDLTMAEMAGVTEAMTGSTEVVVDRAIVAIDDGRKRTTEEIEALLEGKDTTDAKVLKTVDSPDPATTMAGIAEEAGGDEPTVVYIKIKTVIKAIAAVVTVLLEHCKFEKTPEGNIKVTCTI